MEPIWISNKKRKEIYVTYYKCTFGKKYFTGGCIASKRSLINIYEISDFEPVIMNSKDTKEKIVNLENFKI